MENCDCLECEYLAICHGGCAVRAYSTYGDIYVTDPYCYTYKTVYKHLEKKAAELAAERVSGVSRFHASPYRKAINRTEDRPGPKQIEEYWALMVQLEESTCELLAALGSKFHSSGLLTGNRPKLIHPSYFVIMN